MAKILATAKNRGSINVLEKSVRLLREKGYEVDFYLTGTKKETAGLKEGYIIKRFSGVKECMRELKNYDFLLTGLSGKDSDGTWTNDTHFIRAANRLGIKSVGVNDWDDNWKNRIDGLEGIPSKISIMDKRGIETMTKQLSPEIAEEVIKRVEVIGWTAYDDFAQIREQFRPENKKSLLEDLTKLGIKIQEPIYFHATQNVHIEEDPNFFEYESKVTEAVFKVAADFKKKLVIKPHRGEKERFTEEKVKEYGHIFIPSTGCDTKELMLSSRSITAGRSACLREGCLLDINTGGILPGFEYKDIASHPPIVVGAIPYTLVWEGIPTVLGKVTSDNPEVLKKLAKDRKRFSVDGNASQKLVGLIENKILS